MKISCRNLLLSTALVLLTCVQAHASTLFLKIDGLVGESLEQVHLGWSDINEFTWNGAKAGDPGSLATASARPALGPLSVTMAVDKSFPDLNRLMLMGQEIKQVTIDVVAVAGKGPYIAQKIELERAIVTGVSISADNDPSARPTVTVTFGYARVFWTYTTFSTTGKSETIRRGFDVAANRLL